MKQIYFRYFLAIIFVTFLSACSEDDSTETFIPNGPSNAVLNFINSAIDIMESNSINRNTIDWSDFREQVIDRVGNAQNVTNTDSALLLALELLGDNHSLIIKPGGSILSANTSTDCDIRDLGAVFDPADIGYVYVGGFNFSSTSPEAKAFVEDLQNQIRNQDNANLKGWIVDLRNNTGGNMWPMLAGVGPILGEGLVGHFIDPFNEVAPWYYDNGSAILGESTLISADNPYRLINPNPKVAVLLNRATASSGEASAIAFIGRNNTQSFGSPTCGLSTANSTYNLSEGYQLALTVSTMADRNQNLFGEAVNPDNVVDDANTFQAAVDYIND